MDSLQENHTEFIKYNRLILKSKQRFRSKNNNVFTEEINKIALSASDDKRMQSINSIETFAYKINEEIIHKK